MKNEKINNEKNVHYLLTLILFQTHLLLFFIYLDLLFAFFQWNMKLNKNHK